MERWMPFDEQRLLRILRADRGAVYRYLKEGRGNLLDFAHARRISVTGLAGRLLMNRRISSPTFKLTLVERTQRMLTQRHLAEHVIGHIWHHWSLWRPAEPIFGPRFRDLLNTGRSDAEIAYAQGISPAELRTRVMRALARAADRGLEAGAMSRRQARYMVAMQARDIGSIAPEPQPPKARASTRPLLCVLQSAHP